MHARMHHEGKIMGGEKCFGVHGVRTHERAFIGGVMATPEVRWWQALRRALPSVCVTQRLTDRLANAVPDVLWTWDGATGLTELKVGTLYKQQPGRFSVDWRPGQVAWLWKWARAGGMATATVQVRQHVVVLQPAPELDWVRWAEGAVFTLGDPRLQVWERGLQDPEFLKWLRAMWTCASDWR